MLKINFIKNLCFFIYIVSFLPNYGQAMVFKIESPAFKHNGDIPQEYTCQGKDISPELTWSGFPRDTKTFALVCDDPDAPSANPWVHWVVYNIPESVNTLKKDFPKDEKLPDGTLQGVTDFKKVGYGGPCPPAGNPHRYYFKLYALNTILKLAPKASKDELVKAMTGHIIGQTELIGKYQKK